MNVIASPTYILINVYTHFEQICLWSEERYHCAGQLHHKNHIFFFQSCSLKMLRARKALMIFNSMIFNKNNNNHRLMRFFTETKSNWFLFSVQCSCSPTTIPFMCGNT